ncbi:hypothetical protein MLOOGBEN_07950 [Bacillus sp. EB106-08-02-XG196]|uniref:hypothetical protein n=1 Tax=Bacillus sp. EB106-08-02-XG196 TaxID=2737049 RepID=UPI0015C48BA3|nr:hypothetical protein [Bacillus sp. EB106-08-02-XG196]NWQ40630.1 hypothetical protein [Bacillus sp. EB106-08-02-XG196]
MRLEYRLDVEYKNYPAIYNYQDISRIEATARMTCEYFVKDKETFEVSATSMDPDGTAVIYVKRENYNDDSSDTIYSHIGFEVRELKGTSSIVVEKKDVWEHEEIITTLHSDFIYVQKDGKFLEFSLDSREIDEDRKCYVFYGNFTGKSR